MLLREVTVKIHIQLIAKPLELATDKKGFVTEKCSYRKVCTVATLVFTARFYISGTARIMGRKGRETAIKSNKMGRIKS